LEIKRPERKTLSHHSPVLRSVVLEHGGNLSFIMSGLRFLSLPSAFAAFLFDILYPEDGVDIFLRNVGCYNPEDSALPELYCVSDSRLTPLIPEAVGGQICQMMQ
jgi:hypothetical protein